MPMVKLSLAVYSSLSVYLFHEVLAFCSNGTAGCADEAAGHGSLHHAELVRECATGCHGATTATVLSLFPIIFFRLVESQEVRTYRAAKLRLVAGE